jgi:protein farnesyltransferase subunit beta
MPHLAPTYAATLALASLGTPAALARIDRRAMYDFLMRMKSPAPGGAFHMQEDGEADVRGTYTALAVAAMLNLLTPELVRGTAEWVASCQRYEGGFGGEPGNEAHGGYTFCAFAALVILGETKRIDLDALIVRAEFWGGGHSPHPSSTITTSCIETCTWCPLERF